MFRLIRILVRAILAVAMLFGLGVAFLIPGARAYGVAIFAVAALIWLILFRSFG